MISVLILSGIVSLSAIVSAYYVHSLREYRTERECVGTTAWRAALTHAPGYSGRHRDA
jgi:hypothetical protein